MPGPLKKPQQFQRKRSARLPGQTTDEELGLGLTIRYVERPSSTIINRELVRIGNIDLGRYIEIDQDGLRLHANSLVHVDIQADGDLFIGEDISGPGTTTLAIFANNQTYNSESVMAGDVLFGDNSASKANMFWDKSAGQLKFRGGATTQLFIDTDGSLTAGAGDVTINSSGITITPGEDDTEKIKVVDGGTNIVEIYGKTDDGVSSQLFLVGRGKGTSGVDTFEGLVQITAITSDGTPHAGAASAGIVLSTSDNEIELSAGETRILGDLEVTGAAVFNELSQDKDFRIESNDKTAIFFVDGGNNNIGIRNSTPNAYTIMDFSNVNDMAIRLPRLSTTERDNLTPVSAMLIYNKSTDKAQIYTDLGGGRWDDLH